MASSYPYISGAGNIAQMVLQLRKSFPKKVTSETVKKLGIASNNESYVINALQFIGLLGEDGTQTEAAKKVFSHHKDDEFAKSFAELVKEAYAGLFDLHGEGSWSLEIDDIITFFRQSDQTSDAIGRRQAGTFKVFCGLSGHGELPAAKAGKSKSSVAPKPKNKTPVTAKKSAAAPTIDLNKGSTGVSSNKDIGLTVRVEINLPADGSKETYDNIFKSIRENLLDA